MVKDLLLHADIHFTVYTGKYNAFISITVYAGKYNVFHFNYCLYRKIQCFCQFGYFLCQMACVWSMFLIISGPVDWNKVPAKFRHTKTLFKRALITHLFLPNQSFMIISILFSFHVWFISKCILYYISRYSVT